MHRLCQAPEAGIQGIQEGIDRRGQRRHGAGIAPSHQHCARTVMRAGLAAKGQGERPVPDQGNGSGKHRQ